MLPIVTPLSLKPMISTLCDLHIVLGDLGVRLKNSESTLFTLEAASGRQRSMAAASELVK